ncbi:MAG: glucose-6-phosphate isomerase, partial [Clostridiales bacterium]|nr:glucose-6-phosphate isomerase [Clostridiales bacterium]
MMAEYVGSHGIARADLDNMLPKLKSAHAAVEAGRGKGMQGWMDLPYNQDGVLTALERTAERVREFDAFVVLGIGGSALGPAAVHQALRHLHYNELPVEKRGGPRLYIEDNIDPERMAALLDVIDVKTTCFNVVTKSGGTAETMSQYLIVLDLLKKAVGGDYRRHIIVTTSESQGFLIKIARQEGYETFYIPDGVGGRFSELCPVGLLAAAVTGIDIRKLVAGARAMDQRCLNADPWKNPALIEAGLMVAAMEKGANISVMLPYSDAL